MLGIARNHQGIARNYQDLNSYIAHMHQDERFLPELTVREHLLYQVQLRMGLGRAERTQRVDAVLAELGLDKIATQIIGDRHGEAGHHISKNERKRLNFASELLTDPVLLFVDEPTTGLDSYMAESVVRTLTELATGPRRCTIVATITSRPRRPALRQDQLPRRWAPRLPRPARRRAGILHRHRPPRAGALQPRRPRHAPVRGPQRSRGF